MLQELKEENNMKVKKNGQCKQEMFYIQLSMFLKTGLKF